MSRQTVGIRSRTRALLAQALYQAQLAGHGRDELLEQFRHRQEFARVDSKMFQQLLSGIFENREKIDAIIQRLADRPSDQIDPVEFAILSIGLHELTAHADTPYRVIINEAVLLAKRFGAEDGHKYVNALLDKAAAEYRSAEYGAKKSGLSH